MGEEVVLEIVDERDGLLEQLGRLATVHEDGLGTKHLGHLGEHARAALCHEPVAELAYERIGGDAREAVAAAALETYAQLRYRYVLSLVVLGDGIELAQYLHGCLYLVALHFLRDEEPDAVLVVVAQCLHEGIGLIVLAAQSQDEHGASIRMEHNVAQHLASVLMVAREL